MNPKAVSATPAQTPLFITFAEVAAILGCSAKTLRNQRSACRLGFPAIQLSRRMVRFDRADVLEYAARCKEAT